MFVCTVLFIYHAGGQKRDVDSMSVYCWPTVYDAEPTLAQYLVTVSCYVGQRHRRRASINPAFVQSIVQVLQLAWSRPTDYGWMDTSQHWRRCPTCTRHWVGVALHCLTRSLANTRRWTSAGFMLGQRHRRWARIGPALGRRLVFAGSVDRPHLCFAHHRVWGY